MKFGRFKHQDRIFFGIVEGNQVAELDGSPFDSFKTSKMLFSAQHFIAKITQYMTLHPGDVIWLGTDGATEPDLKDGDVVEIEQKDIGVLRSPVVRER